MRTGASDVARGLFIAMAVLSLAGMAIYFFTAGASPLMNPTPTPTPTSTLTITPSPTASLTPSPTPSLTSAPVPTETPAGPPTETLTPTETNTPDPVQQALNRGELVFSGPLSEAEQMALYRASLLYIRNSPGESRVLAKQINGVGYGDPSNICGPLAEAMLRDAGLVPNDIIPHDFWLLNPSASTDTRLLERAFPWETTSHVSIATPINKMDWRLDPLLPGDFLFIWHGSGGNFDHMLVVTHVDSAGRAYSVTNFGTDAGYIIAEAVLYDPSDPTVGLFHQWTRERNAILGSTGFGGFERWRRRPPG